MIVWQISLARSGSLSGLVSGSLLLSAWLYLARSGSLWLFLAHWLALWLSRYSAPVPSGSLWPSVAHTLAPSGPLVLIIQLTVYTTVLHKALAWLAAPLPSRRILTDAFQPNQTSAFQE